MSILFCFSVVLGFKNFFSMHIPFFLFLLSCYIFNFFTYTIVVFCCLLLFFKCIFMYNYFHGFLIFCYIFTTLLTLCYSVLLISFNIFKLFLLYQHNFVCFFPFHIFKMFALFITLFFFSNVFSHFKNVLMIPMLFCFMITSNFLKISLLKLFHILFFCYLLIFWKFFLHIFTCLSFLCLINF